MRYGFINNFSQAIAVELAQGATTMTLNDGGASLSNASTDLVYMLTLSDGEGAVEIVRVTAVSGNDLTVVRGQDGTSDVTWPAQTRVEARLTAAIADAFFQPEDRLEIGPYTVRIGPGTTAFYWDDSVVIGRDCGVAEDNWGSTAIGKDAFVEALSNSAIAMGERAKCLEGSFAGVAIGNRSNVNGNRGVSIGNFSEAVVDSVAVGSLCKSFAESSAAYGHGAESFADSSTAIGGWTYTPGIKSTALGHSSVTHETASESVALGYSADARLAGGARLAALPYLPAVSETGTFAAPSATRRAAARVAVAFDVLDLTDGTAAESLGLPAGSMLFAESIDVVVTASDGAGGGPEISVGTSDTDPASLLAITPVAATNVGERDVHSPATPNGASSLYVAVATAGTGTSYMARVVVHGYVMEL